MTKTAPFERQMQELHRGTRPNLVFPEEISLRRLGLTKPTKKFLEECQPVSAKAPAHVIHSIWIDSKLFFSWIKHIPGSDGLFKAWNG